jgi:hypothetical protein
MNEMKITISYFLARDAAQGSIQTLTATVDGAEIIGLKAHIRGDGPGVYTKLLSELGQLIDKANVRR